MKTLVLTLALLASSATAQDLAPDLDQPTSELKYFVTRQECMPALQMFESISKYAEEPLFIAQGLQMSSAGQPYTGGVMFFVNQDTGTWTLATLYADGTVCMTAAGTNFQPYVGGTVADNR